MSFLKKQIEKGACLQYNELVFNQLCLFEGYLSKELRTMVIRVGGINRRPGQIVRLWCCIGTFVEVAMKSYWFVFIFYTYDFKRYCNYKIPWKYAFEFVERTVATGGVSTHFVKLLIWQQLPAMPVHALCGMNCSDAVEFEVKVWGYAFRRYKKFHTAVLIYIRVVFVIYSSQIVAPHKKVYVNACFGMSYRKGGKRMIRIIVFPVKAVMCFFFAFFVK